MATSSQNTEAKKIIGIIEKNWMTRFREKDQRFIRLEMYSDKLSKIDWKSEVETVEYLKLTVVQNELQKNYNLFIEHFARGQRTEIKDENHIFGIWKSKIKFLGVNN